MEQKRKNREKKIRGAECEAAAVRHQSAAAHAPSAGGASVGLGGGGGGSLARVASRRHSRRCCRPLPTAVRGVRSRGDGVARRHPRGDREGAPVQRRVPVPRRADPRPPIRTRP